MVSGSLFPRVSGRNMKTRTPPMRAPVPMMSKGRGSQTADRLAIWGARMPPTLPHRELAPTAELLICRHEMIG